MEWRPSFTRLPVYPQGNGSQCPLNRIASGPQSLWNFWRRKKSLVQAENRTSLQPSHYAGCVKDSYPQLDWVSEVFLECIREFQIVCQVFLLYVSLNSRQGSLYRNHTRWCNTHNAHQCLQWYIIAKACVLCDCKHWYTLWDCVTSRWSLTLRRRIKSHLLFAGIIRSSPFSPR